MNSNDEQFQKMSWWQNLGPDLKAAILFQALWFVVNAFTNLTAGLALCIIIPIVTVTFLFEGALAAKLAAKDSRYVNPDYLKLGFSCAVWSVVIAFVVSLIQVAVLFGLTLGALLAALPTLLAAQVGVGITHLIATPIGSWFYGKRIKN